ncbi:MAG TPA: TlpA disulfide reductase family protein [Puia sp.]|nr:TlpA disulfide reductase family protein [Puia sp.]
MNLKITIMAILLPGIGFCQQAGRFTLSGELGNMKLPVAGVYLKSMEDNNKTYQAVVRNGRYFIQGTLDGPTEMNILPIYDKQVDRTKLDNEVLFIYLEPGNTKIKHTGSFRNMTLTGSPAEAAHEKLGALIKEKEAAYASGQEIKEVYGDYVKAHPESPIAVYALKRYAEKDHEDKEMSAVSPRDMPFSMESIYLAYSGRTDAARVLPLFHLLPAPLQQSTAGRNFARDIEWGRLDIAAKPYMTRLDSLVKLYAVAHKDSNAQRKDSNIRRMAELEGQMKETALPIREEIYAGYLKNNPRSPVAIGVLEWYSGPNFSDPARSAELFNALDSPVRQSPEGKKFGQRLELALRTAIGQPAPLFTQTDTAGNPVSLQSFRGKYVFLDFWASWCMPCRAENPNVVAAYDRYKDRNFTVLSVSLDKDKQKWLDAIYKDQLNWTQVSDLKYWKNEAAVLYQVIGIPNNFLIAPDGTIVAKDLHGNDLQEKLAELIRE